MIRTQVQFPEPLYKRLKEIARQKDWPFAEVVRRATERYADQHPGKRGKASEYKLPEPLDLGPFKQPPENVNCEVEAILARTKVDPTPQKARRLKK